MQYAVEHSNSRVAELSGKLKSGELMIQYLNERLDQSKYDSDQLSKCKVKIVIVVVLLWILVSYFLLFDYVISKQPSRVLLVFHLINSISA